MTGFSVLLVILLPMVAVSIVVACLPLRRSRRLRVAVLAAHVAASVALMALLDGPFALWLMVLGAGLAVALGRLVGDAASALRRAQAPAGSR